MVSISSEIRPETSTVVARRMIGNILNIPELKNKPDGRELEKEKLKQNAKKRETGTPKRDYWEE